MPRTTCLDVTHLLNLVALCVVLVVLVVTTSMEPPRPLRQQVFRLGERSRVWPAHRHTLRRADNTGWSKTAECSPCNHTALRRGLGKA